MKKTSWEKEKMLVASIFSFSLDVFKKLPSQCRENKEVFGKVLNDCRPTRYNSKTIKFLNFKKVTKYVEKTERTAGVNNEYELLMKMNKTFLFLGGFFFYL